MLHSMSIDFRDLLSVNISNIWIIVWIEINSSLTTIIDKEILWVKILSSYNKSLDSFTCLFKVLPHNNHPTSSGLDRGDTLLIIQALELIHSIFRTQCLLVQVTHRESKYANSTLDILRLTTCLVRRYYKVPNSALTSSVDFFSVYRRMKIVQKEWYQDKWYVVIGPEQCASQ